MKQCTCGAELPHFNSLRCKPCAERYAKERDRAQKGITLAADAPECPVCHARFNVITAGHFRTHGYPDAKVFKAAFGLALLKAPSIAAKQSAFMSANSPTRGRKRTESELALMSQNRLGKGAGVAGKYTRTKDIRERISKSVTDFQARNPTFANKHFKSGWCFSEKADGEVWVRSSWERRVLAVLDQYEAITEVVVEPFALPYEWDGAVHQYTPDFLVTFDEVLSEIWEVKPEDQIKSERNQAKFKAVEGYAQAHGMNFRVVTLETIERMELQTKRDKPISTDLLHKKQESVPRQRT